MRTKQTAARKPKALRAPAQSADIVCALEFGPPPARTIYDRKEPRARPAARRKR